MLSYSKLSTGFTPQKGRMQARCRRPSIQINAAWLPGSGYKMPPGSLSYGVELEFLFPSHYVRANVEQTMRKTNWRVKTDRSIQGIGLGLEINSPILTGTSGFQSIASACREASSLSPQLNHSTALHVHVGRNGSKWQLNQLQNLCANFILMEACFDALCPSYRKDSIYARSNTKLFLDTSLAIQRFQETTTIEQLVSLFNPGADARREGRRYKLNLRSLNKHNTVEFRQFAGTCSPEEVAGITALCAWFAILAGEQFVAPSALNHVLCGRSSPVQQLTTFLSPAGKDLAEFVKKRANPPAI